MMATMETNHRDPVLRPRLSRRSAVSASTIASSWDAESLESLDTLPSRNVIRPRRSFTGLSLLEWSPPPIGIATEELNNIQPCSLLHKQRSDCFNQMAWSADAVHRSQAREFVYRNHVRAFQFSQNASWDGEYRLDKILAQKWPNPSELQESDNELEAALKNWFVETTDISTIRLIMCERPNTGHGMSLSGTAFELIEEEFDLHPATLPCFYTAKGVHSTFTTKDARSSLMDDAVWIVAKATQKVAIGNWTLSLKHNSKTKRTDAFICGEQLLENYHGFEAQYADIFRAIHACQDLWEQPLILPTIMLQAYAQRLQHRYMIIDRRIRHVEQNLRVTLAGSTWHNHSLENWPRDVDVKNSTIELHSLIRQVLSIQSAVSWSQRFCEFLQEYSTQTIKGKDTITREDSAFQYQNGVEAILLGETLTFYLSTIEALSVSYNLVRDRCQAQADLLFSIISQQDSIESNSIAGSAFVFTLISALFLPATFVATVFSMSMFDWQPDPDPDSGASYVSPKFWIFWVVSCPLTLVVMGSWYWWSKRGMDRWKRSHRRVGEKAQGWRQRWQANSRWVRFLGPATRPDGA